MGHDRGLQYWDLGLGIFSLFSRALKRKIICSERGE